jgi:hypothetical protein
MKKLLITFGALIILNSCGYSSEDECLLKEMQKCDSGSCENQARYYCSDEFPSKTQAKRYIYDKLNYPLNWVTVNVDSFKVYIQETKPRRQNVLVCIDKAWTIGKGKCKRVWLNSAASYPNGTSWTYSDSGLDSFYKYINESGDGLKEGTTINVYESKSVGFIRYYFGWIFYWFLWGAAIFIVIVLLLSPFVGESKTEDEDIYEEENEEVEQSNRFLILVPYLLIGAVIGGFIGWFVLNPLLSYFGL